MKNLATLASLGILLFIMIFSFFKPKDVLSQDVLSEQVVKVDTTNSIDSLVETATDKIDNITNQAKRGKQLAKIAQKKSKESKTKIIIREVEKPSIGTVLSKEPNKDKPIIVTSDTTYIEANKSKKFSKRSIFQKIFGKKNN